MKKLVVILTALVGLLALTDQVHAKKMTLEPSVLLVLAADESGLAKVAVRFDLSGLPEAENRQINHAFLEWHPAGTTPDGETALRSFEVQRIVASWSNTPQSTVTVSATPEAVWDITAGEYERDEESYVRLDVTDALRAWNDEGADSFGYLISTAALTRNNAVAAAGGVVLRVSYGCRP